MIRRNRGGTTPKRTGSEGRMMDDREGITKDASGLRRVSAPWDDATSPSPFQDVPAPKQYPATTRARCWGDHCEVTVPMSHVRRGLTESCGAEGCGPEHPYARGSQA